LLLFSLLYFCAFILRKRNVFDYLENLNKAQMEAVIRTEGPSLIIAGAGSGKTRVLTYRIAHLLKQGIKPSSILALTFTNKAAKEMKERIAAVVGPNLSRYLWMGTFHSIFARILRFEHEALGFPSDFTIYDASDAKNLIKTIIRDFQLDDKIYKTGVVSSRISMAKNNLITPQAYAGSADIREFDRSIHMPRISEVYREYAKRCTLSHAMDFDDLLLKTNILLRDFPEILEKYQNRFDYLLVDEYQDTNYAQYLIIKKLAEKHKNICVVGDDAQSIYSFRGARIENILNFKKDYQEHRIFKLEQNYRSTQNIVNAANSVIAHNKKQLRKEVFSENEPGGRLKLLEALTDNEEGFLVASSIAEVQLRDHVPFSDFAILYRTNAQSRIFEEALRKRSIPYKIYGGLSFYQRKEIKDLLAYFRVIINPADNEALKRIINYPARGIGPTTLAKLEKTALDNEKDIYSIINALPAYNPGGLNKGTIEKLKLFESVMESFRALAKTAEAYDLARKVATQTGILKDLHNDKTPEGVSKYQNIEEMLNAIQEFTISAREEGRMGKLGDYLQDVALLTDQDSEKEEDRNKVTLMTVHSAKGLEFKYVFIVGMEENLFPGNPSGNGAIQADALEEERRLFYVAITRARNQVFLSHAGQRYKWGKLEYCRPSSFIREIDPAFLENTSTSANTWQYNQTAMRQPERPSRQEPVQPPNLLNQSPALQTTFRQKLTRMNEIAASSKEFQGDDPGDILPGMKVEHQRFGSGKVLQVEGTAPDIKATIFFHNAGQKQLLLKFAKLKIIP
jgi:DNA helicase II / ATP-dependent DNA helicase PcrA